eukprot:gene6567-3219_t
MDAFTRLEGNLERLVNTKMSEPGYVSRLTALSAIQPGLINLYGDILCPSAHTLFLKTPPSCWPGKSYAEGRRKLDTGIAVGYVRNGKTVLDPKDEEIMQPDDKVVVISSKLGPKDKVESPDALRGFFFNAARKAEKWREADVNSRPSGKAKPVNIIVIDYVGAGLRWLL